MYCRHSAAIFIMVVIFINTICPPPPQPHLSSVIGEGCAVSSNSNGTRSVYMAERTQKSVYILWDVYGTTTHTQIPFLSSETRPHAVFVTRCPQTCAWHCARACAQAAALLSCKYANQWAPKFRAKYSDRCWPTFHLVNRSSYNMREPAGW
jgi:hypothetical protein